MTKRAKRFSMSFSEAEFRAVHNLLGGTPGNSVFYQIYDRVDNQLARYDSLRLHAEREEAVK